MRLIMLVGAFWSGFWVLVMAAQAQNVKVDTPMANTVSKASFHQTFEDWLKEFRARALTNGIRSDVFEDAFSGLSVNEDIIARDRNQGEFSRSIWQYLDAAVSDERIANGRRALAQNPALFEAIEKRYGVEKEVVIAIWGLESSYGVRRGDVLVIQALATLAYEGRRRSFFENELIAALMILQQGDVSAEDMRGSWAGAMGHTQFMPSSWWNFAVDFDGDQKRNIWAEHPGDALASAANYLKISGWRFGAPWGVEVFLPEGFDYSLAGLRTPRLVSEWDAMGVRALNGLKAPDYGAASLLLPAGAGGVAFLIYENFGVIEKYNSSDAYVIAVGHLADRIGGAGPFRSSWPRSLKELSKDQKAELQARLSAAGYDTQGVDGIVGPDTAMAIKAWQRDNNRIPDGYPTEELLRAVRNNR